MQGGMELDLAEVSRGSTSDSDRGKRLTACQGTQGTNMAARRCSEDPRRERLVLASVAWAVKLCLPRVSAKMLKLLN